jgi:hypothetical protein
MGEVLVDLVGLVELAATVAADLVGGRGLDQADDGPRGDADEVDNAGRLSTSG